MTRRVPWTAGHCCPGGESAAGGFPPTLNLNPQSQTVGVQGARILCLSREFMSYLAGNQFVSMPLSGLCVCWASSDQPQGENGGVA